MNKVFMVTKLLACRSETYSKVKSNSIHTVCFEKQEPFPLVRRMHYFMISCFNILILFINSSCVSFW